ncbi:MAG: DNA repair protein RecN, partial [Candidatus Aminicenantes bacterium]|nr:DNA repair protein RecN [Candidatus Aminicenantes bacterium]
MLTYLRVENFAVVEKVEIHFCPELNILTGETGAGKSLLIDAIKLLIDKKIPPNSIRDKTKKLKVEAFFEKNGNEFVLRREISSGNKNRSLTFLDGEAVPFHKLKEAAEKLLNIYGQNEYLFLLSPANHLDFLDRFSDNGAPLTTLGELFNELTVLKADMEDLKDSEKNASEKVDFIDFQLLEIRDIDLDKESEDELEQKVRILSSAEEIINSSDHVLDNIYRSETSVYNRLTDSLKSIDFLYSIYPEMSEFRDEIQKFYKAIPEISTLLSEQGVNIEHNEAELNRTEEKLFKIKKLKTKYNVDFAGLKQKKVELLAEKERFQNMEFSIQEKEKEISEKLKEYCMVNKKIRTIRKEHSRVLRELVEKELSRLEMEKAQFVVDFTEKEPELTNINAKGTDKIEFMFSSNPGMDPGKIKDIASGGELSRLMLVLKSIIKDDTEISYIFDEIDSGIGGKTADFVGSKLKDISKRSQVICISHLPQIASFADRHFLIGKEYRDDTTFSTVKILDEHEQREEV